MGTAGPATPPPMAFGAPGYPGYPGGSPFDVQRKQQIDRTKTGVLLILIGILIGWIPIIGAVGSILILIGAILVILGRKAFGPAHSRNVLMSIVLFFVGLIILGVSVVVLTLGLAAALAGGAPSLAAVQAAVRSALNSFLIIALVASLILGLPNILFTFAIQNQTGRLLLIAGYVANIAIQIAIIIAVSATFPQVIAAMFPAGTYNAAAAQAAIAGFSAQVSSYGPLSAISSVLYAAAYYLVWSRINRGEIPPSTAPPMAPPPAMSP